MSGEEWETSRVTAAASSSSSGVSGVFCSTLSACVVSAFDGAGLVCALAVLMSADVARTRQAAKSKDDFLRTVGMRCHSLWLWGPGILGAGDLERAGEVLCLTRII